MKRLTLSDVGNLAEAFAAIGVIVSLIYLALQIQQNTNALRASSYQDVANGVTEFQMLVAQNKSLARIYLKGAEDPGQLTPEERTQFGMYLGMYFARFDTALELYHRGMIDDKAMTPYTRFMLYTLKMPGVADYWKQYQHFFSDDMRSYIRDKIGSDLE